MRTNPEPKDNSSTHSPNDAANGSAAHPPVPGHAGQPKGIALHWQIFIALILAVALGLVLPEKIGTVQSSAIFSFVGKMFLKALQMLVVPLIGAALISSLARMGGERAFARLGLKTLAFYTMTTLLAVVLALFIFNWVRPGQVAPEISKTMIAAASDDAAKVAGMVANRGAADIVGIFDRMIPGNIVEAAAKNNEMLAVIFFSLIFGYFMTRLPGERSERFGRWWSDFYEVMILMTGWVIRFTPLGVFALVTATVADTGLATFVPLVKFFGCVLLALCIHMFVTLSLLLRAFGLSPLRHLRNMAPVLLTAFSTASSSGTLPVTLSCLERNSQVPRRVASFTVPLGATVNMDGTALYECSVVLFVAQIYGVDLSVMQQVLVVLLALLTSIGVAGIPAASLVAIVIILGAVGLPAEAIGIVLAVDRLLDMCRTAVNVFGDTCGAVVIAKTEERHIQHP